MVLPSGAWKTWAIFSILRDKELMRRRWISLLSCAYTNKLGFALLQTPTHGSVTAAGAKVQLPLFSSPRSMYSLSAAVSILPMSIVPIPDELESLK